MPDLVRPMRRNFGLRGGLHGRGISMARCALRTCYQFHRARPPVFFMACGGPKLDRIRLLKCVSPFAQVGVASLASIIDLLDPAGRAAPTETLTHHLNKLPGS